MKTKVCFLNRWDGRWDEVGPPLILKRMFLNRWDGRWDEVGRPSPVFNGRNRPTPFGLYKINKKREGWGRRMGKVGAQDGPQSIVVKPRSYTGSVWHGLLL